MSATNPDADYGAPPPYSPGSNPDTEHDSGTEHDLDTEHDLETEHDLDTEHDALPPDSPHDSVFSDTDSCESLDIHIVSYRKKYGRTYHNLKTGQYLYPNDDQENNRLDLQHALFNILLDGRLFLTPISTRPHNILNIGTGIGIWAIDMADLYSCASVLSIDISPIQPRFVSPNCKFKVKDADNNWIFRLSFDFIHYRQV